jgi:hypothetical protein
VLTFDLVLQFTIALRKLAYDFVATWRGEIARPRSEPNHATDCKAVTAYRFSLERPHDRT